MARTSETQPVLIAGAGPVGLIAALALAQRQVPVIVFEAEVRFSHRVRAVRQDADGVTITMETPDGIGEQSGSYLIGADGGRSVVRGELGIEFDGFTYPDDAVNLAGKLARVWKGEADDGLLDLYDRQRRTTNKEFIQA